MDYNTFKLIAEIVSWLSFPLMGVIVGVIIGFIYRKAGASINRGPNFFLPVEVGALIGFGIALGGLLMSYILNPAFWEGVNMVMVLVRELVGFTLYILIIDFISMKIANKPNPSVPAAI